jgi:hypothetical protein
MRLDPHDILDRYAPRLNKGQVIGSRQSGQVLGGDWDQYRTPYKNTPKYKACAARFRDGASWEETGIIADSMGRLAKSGPFDGCATQADILARYAALDTLWRITQDQGHLPKAPQRAKDGILVHIDRAGRPLFGNQGFHRLAIAQLAGLKEVSVSLGLTHVDAVRSGAFLSYLRD